MDVYVDTSAFLAVLDADDKNHEQAKKVWKELLTSEVSLICSSYVLVETYALVQNRLGMEATRVFHEDIYHLLQIEWVEKSLHMYGINSVLIANRRSLSLVDCVSFVIMRKMGIKKVFTFDTHFVEQGFECI
ncbi:twitching motility protein PilT [Peptococcaceae bacterium SCADC1_2_3]|nr:twitching motility protein PilT [Peptococcaceae bacterium SCADC1_2_3]KFI36524.1 twitching motility protein PilT [Peptococcaceae bacterium SCADC1_2_3]KFI37963.1 twitching motility protein PilT [Peptococcaceae bacterium SCADC1_2_3]